MHYKYYYQGYKNFIKYTVHVPVRYIIKALMMKNVQHMRLTDNPGIQGNAGQWFERGHAEHAQSDVF